MFILGSTVHTAKESYRIIFPTVSRTLMPTLFNESLAVNQILLKLIESDEFKQSERNLLPATNLFVLFKQPVNVKDQNDNMNELRNFKLTKSCKKFVIQFRDSTDFDIFEEDFQELNLDNNRKNEDNAPAETWLQSKVFAKGFKDALVNNKSIWH